MNESKRKSKKAAVGKANSKLKAGQPADPESKYTYHDPGRFHYKKSWNAYLFDFFMLFLAVFCGYLAQWQLENSGEHQRENQFVQSLTEDLKKDTTLLKYYISFNQNTLSYCDSLQNCIVNTDIIKNSNRFYDYSRELARYLRYYPSDRTIQQLKNAGNMRLIRKWNVSNAITDYDNKTKYLTEFDQQLNGEKNKYRAYLIEHLDLSAYDRFNLPGSFMNNNMTTQGNPGFMKMDSSEAKLLYNQAFSLKTFLSVVIIAAEEQKTEAIKLFELLQKEYHLKAVD